jgi:glycosyltransferase involved in cell wall biosynthesis
MVAPSGTDNFSVSVIIPTYNRSAFLKSALESVNSQSYPIKEILVIDDGSTDQTVENLTPNFKSVIFIRQENQGVSAARNTGIKKATGEWIALLDSDDLWTVGKIEKQIAHLRQNPKIKACHSGEEWVRNGRHVNIPTRLNKSNDGLFSRSLDRCIICPSSILIHRSVFKKIGIFDEDLPLCEDYDFWIRLLLHYEIGLVKEALVIKQGGHSDQLSTSTWGLDRFRVQSLEKILASEPLNPNQKIAILSAIARKADLLSKGFSKHEKREEAIFYMNKNSQAYQNISGLKNIKVS